MGDEPLVVILAWWLLGAVAGAGYMPHLLGLGGGPRERLLGAFGGAGLGAVGAFFVLYDRCRVAEEVARAVTSGG